MGLKARHSDSHRDLSLLAVVFSGEEPVAALRCLLHSGNLQTPL